MLGKAADTFMLNQMKERIVAVPSNAKGQSLEIPDRERAGTPRFTMASTIRPGPDNAMPSCWTPGATALQAPRTITMSNGYYPGEGFNADAPVPAEDRRFGSFLGAEPENAPAPAVAPPLLNTKTLMVLGGLAIGAYLLLKRK